MKIVLLGPPGSGKGTQAAMMAKRFGIPHVSSGDILREIASQPTPRGEEVKEILASGKYFPDDLTFSLIKERLSKPDCKKGWILDGFPRTISQARMLDTFSPPDRVLYLHVSDAVAVHRLSSRRTCKKCGAIYGEANPPKKLGVCDACGGELYQREDQKPAAIKVRLEVFHKETEPLLEFYTKKGIVAKVDAERTIDGLFGDVVKALGRAT